MSWQSSALRAPPPTTCTTSTGRPLSAPASRTLRAVGQREAVQDAAHDLGPGRRQGLPGARQRLGDARRHVPRRQERRVVDVDHRPAGGRRGRLGEQRGQVGRCPTRAWHSLSTQSPITLRRKRIVPSTPPSLVKFGAPGLLGQHRRVELDADQRPGAGGDVRRTRSPSRGYGRRPPTRCRASRPRPRGAGARPVASATARQQPAEQVAGLAERQAGSRRDADPLGQPGRPVAGARRRPAGWSRRWCARRPTSPVSQYAEQVREQQHASRRRRAAGRARPRAGRSC